MPGKPEERLYQYTAIDEYTRLRYLGAYPEQSTYSSADFLEKMAAWFKRRGIQVECVQTDNGFEFTNRFSNSKKDLPTQFELTAARLGIRHKLIRPYTPRHNGRWNAATARIRSGSTIRTASSLLPILVCSSLHTKIAPTTCPCALFPGSPPEKNLPLPSSLSLSNMFDKPTFFEARTRAARSGGRKHGVRKEAAGQGVTFPCRRKRIWFS